jgi:hypothetical protein
MADRNTPSSPFGFLHTAFWRGRSRPPSSIDAVIQLENNSRGVVDSNPDQDEKLGRSQVNPPTDLQTASLFSCPERGCSKSFIRREHLNRHLATHAEVRRFKCESCGRRFTRRSVFLDPEKINAQSEFQANVWPCSDVLRRHMRQHSKILPVSRAQVACTACRRKKLRCNNNTPCRTCEAAGADCVRDSGDSEVAVKRNVSSL